MLKGNNHEVAHAQPEAVLVPDCAAPLNVDCTPAESAAGVMPQKLAELERGLRRGVIMDRRTIRRLQQRLEPSRDHWSVPWAQLNFLLSMRGWKQLALSGPSLEQVRVYGFTVGKIN